MSEPFSYYLPYADMLKEELTFTDLSVLADLVKSTIGNVAVLDDHYATKFEELGLVNTRSHTITRAGLAAVRVYELAIEHGA